MGFFLKALAAIVIGDAIDRHARRPPKYWYPNHPGRARPGERRPDPGFDQMRQPLGGDWNPEHPERP
jgi:hypothetical protein